MFYSLHTTKKAERDILLFGDDTGKPIMIPPKSFHGKNPKSIVCEEGTNKYYEHDYHDFHALLAEIDKDKNYHYEDSIYYKNWIHNGSDLNTRLSNLPALFDSIKKEGIKEPVHCEVTGERLDGSYRTKIALYLGIKRVPAILHRFKWTDIDEDFIERKLKTRWLSSGKDYYEFLYGYKDWKNIPDGGPVYIENAERADMICDLVKGYNVLDLGCNEGYISIQLARKGHKVLGIDHDLIHIAWLNRLIFEFVDKKDIDVNFIEQDICDIIGKDMNFDTILMLNVLYHLPRDKQKPLVMQFKDKQMIFQCNLRKSEVREEYYTSHPDDLCKLLDECGIKYKVIEWRDKPLVVTYV